MIRETVSLNEVIEFLNECLEFDREAISALAETRVECNRALAEHPTVQVVGDEEANFSVGLLGILNGLFGTIESGKYEGWGELAATFESNGLISFFRRTGGIRKK